MTDQAMLPKAFAALEPFVSRWNVATTAERAALRTSSEIEERKLFFGAASPLLDQALDHLDSHPLGALPDAEQRLMNLMLSLAHVALAVEIQGPDEVKSAPWRDRMHIVQSAADQPAG